MNRFSLHTFSMGEPGDGGFSLGGFDNSNFDNSNFDNSNFSLRRFSMGPPPPSQPQSNPLLQALDEYTNVRPTIRRR